jgi:hypothetical protein
MFTFKLAAVGLFLVVATFMWLPPALHAAVTAALVLLVLVVSIARRWGSRTRELTRQEAQRRTTCPSCRRRERERLDALGPAPRRTAPRPDAPRLRPGRPNRQIQGSPATRAFAELLIDCEEDRVLRAVLVGMLREVDR